MPLLHSIPSPPAILLLVIFRFRVDLLRRRGRLGLHLTPSAGCPRDRRRGLAQPLWQRLLGLGLGGQPSRKVRLASIIIWNRRRLGLGRDPRRWPRRYRSTEWIIFPRVFAVVVIVVYGAPGIENVVLFLFVVVRGDEHWLLGYRPTAQRLGGRTQGLLG